MQKKKNDLENEVFQLRTKYRVGYLKNKALFQFVRRIVDQTSNFQIWVDESSLFSRKAEIVR